MENLPKDVIIQLALEFDLPSILSLCQTSTKLNMLICENNTFWINKLRKDFDILKYRTDAKAYYENLMEHLKEDDPDTLLLIGIEMEDLDLVKFSVAKGANVNDTSIIYTPLIFSLGVNGNDDIFHYLLNIAINSKETAMLNLKSFLNKIDAQTKSKTKELLSAKLYDIFLPKLYKYIDIYRFWEASLSKLEEIAKEVPEIFEDIYKRRAPELQALKNKYFKRLD